MVNTVCILDKTDALPALFKRAVEGYISVENKDEPEFVSILKHATDHIQEAYFMLTTLQSYSGDPNEENRHDMRVLSEELSAAMGALTRFQLFNEFQAMKGVQTT